MELAIATAATGSGIVTGLLFAFSNFVMRALGELPHESGIRAMQRINEEILNPIFFVFFFGTPTLCAGIAVEALLRGESPTHLAAVAGALGYLAGPFGITLAFNVPLNDALAKEDPATGEAAWLAYQRDWQRWNHIRTAIGVAATALLAIDAALH